MVINRTALLTLGALGTGGLLLIGLPLVMVVAVMGGSNQTGSDCADSNVVLAGATAATLTEEQKANATTVIAEGYRLGMSEQAILVALTVAAQESRFLVYANDGRGADLRPDQAGIADSLQLPHQAVGSDHGSLGIFQQQWPWWGSMPELMDPATSARKFYTALGKVPGWEQMSIPDAGQAVQHSAHPHAYDDDVTLAQELLRDAGGATSVEEAAYFGATTSPCDSPAYTGAVAFPLRAGVAYVDQANYGHAGSHWTSTHSGTDLAAACGSPVVAATDGTVTVRTDQSWAGPWLVEIDAGGPDGTVTWYGHMQHVDVTPGQPVAAGQTIGQVGSLGNSTGCHLHFEVHPGGGDPVNPTDWLAKNAGKKLGHVVPAMGTPDGTGDSSSSAGTGESAVLLTANLPFWLSDAKVEHRIGELLAENPDVLILQEIARRDIATLVASAPGSWAVWQPPAPRDRTAIVWNASKYAVARKGAAFGVRTDTYETWLPWVLLKGDSGTLPVVGMHLPTNSSKDARMAGYFRQMTQHYLQLIGEMNAAGYPPVVGGDWNHPLDKARESWSPVPQLEGVGMTTNWQHGHPCSGTSAYGGRIDGFAFNPDYLQVVDQGCLDRGPSDHRPVWIAVTSAG